MFYFPIRHKFLFHMFLCTLFCKFHELSYSTESMRNNITIHAYNSNTYHYNRTPLWCFRIATIWLDKNASENIQKYWNLRVSSLTHVLEISVFPMKSFMRKVCPFIVMQIFVLFLVEGMPITFFSIHIRTANWMWARHLISLDSYDVRNTWTFQLLVSLFKFSNIDVV